MAEQQVPSSACPRSSPSPSRKLPCAMEANLPPRSDILKVSASDLESSTGDLLNTDLRVQLEKFMESFLTKKLEEHKSVPEALDRSKAYSASFTNLVKATISKLFAKNDKGELSFIGTMVFITEDTGITCFNCVHEDGHILQDSLCVDVEGAYLNLVHLASYPYYDLSVYKCQGRNAECLPLGATGSLGTGAAIYLVSYPDLWTKQYDIARPMVVCPGNVCGIDEHNVLGQYQCFSGSSGGAVVSSKAELLGLHLESVYSQDEQTLAPLDLSSDCEPYEVVKELFWDKGANMVSNDQYWKGASNDDRSLFAVQNIGNKGHLGRFLPVHDIRTVLQLGGILPKSRARKRQCS